MDDIFVPKLMWLIEMRSLQTIKEKQAIVGLVLYYAAYSTYNF